MSGEQESTEPAVVAVEEAGAVPIEACANCRQALSGPFCAQCGQAIRDVGRITVGQLVNEWFGNVFSFDSRLVRTLKPLITQPGLLTEEYLAGRRVRYVPPLRLFVFLSVVMLLVLALSGTHLSFQLSRDGERLLGSGRYYEIPDAAESAESGSDSDDMLKIRDAEELNRRLLDRSPQALLLLVPVVALFLWGLHRRRQPLYMPHLIFSLHVHCFAFLLVAAATLLDLPFDSFPPGKLVLMVGIPVYLYRAQKRVYGGAWLANVLRTVVLVVAQQICFIAVMIGLLFLTAFLG